jgi:hypothetical protein
LVGSLETSRRIHEHLIGLGINPERLVSLRTAAVERESVVTNDV